MTRYLLLIWLVAFCFTGRSQDQGFTQFYANPLYLNPALAGVSGCTNITLNYRNQWPTIGDGFVTYSASVDHQIDKLSGGLGFIVSQDEAMGYLTNQNAAVIYSYHLKIGNNSQLNAGFQAGLHQRKIDFDNLIFPDMIDPLSGQIAQNSQEVAPEVSSKMVPDFSVGFLLGISEKYTVGLSGHHLTQPNLSFYGLEGDYYLPMKITFHASANLKLRESVYQSETGEIAMQPGVLYHYQYNNEQIAGGVNFSYYPLTLGAWYRYSSGLSDAVAILAGLKHKNFKFGYSYDFTVSELMGESGGSHELSIGWIVNCEGKRNRAGAIKCPEF